MAMPGNNIRWLLSRYQSPEVTWSAWWSVAVTSSGHPHYQRQNCSPVSSTRFQRYRTRTRLLTSFSGNIFSKLNRRGMQLGFTWNDDWTLTLESSLVLSRLDQKVCWPFAPFQHKVAVGGDIWMNDSNQQYYEYYY